MRKGDTIEHKDKTVGANGYPHDKLYYYSNECRIKLSNGEWIDGVIYADLNPLNRQMYVREKEDFYNEFKKYEDKH